MNIDDFCDREAINDMGIKVAIINGAKDLQPSSHYGGLRASNSWLVRSLLKSN